jgi:hypothetical protein
MLISVDGQSALLYQARADSVCPLAFFAPDSSRPKSPFPECLVVGDGATPLNRDAVAVGEKNTAANAPNRAVQSIKANTGSPDQRFDLLASKAQLRIRQSFRSIAFGRVEPVKVCRSAPGCDKCGPGRSVRADRLLD